MIQRYSACLVLLVCCVYLGCASQPSGWEYCLWPNCSPFIIYSTWWLVREVSTALLLLLLLLLLLFLLPLALWYFIYCNNQFVWELGTLHVWFVIVFPFQNDHKLTPIQYHLLDKFWKDKPPMYFLFIHSFAKSQLSRFGLSIFGSNVHFWVESSVGKSSSFHP